MSTVAVHTATSADADAIASLLGRVAEGPTQSADELRTILAADEAWLLGSREAVGFLALRLRGPDVADAELACERGHEDILVEAAETRARELGARLLRIVPLDARDRLRRFGYVEVRSFLRLGREVPPTALPPALERIAPTAREVHAIEQAGFADAWGFVPERYGDWRARVGHRFAGGAALLARRDGSPAGSIRCSSRYGWGWIPTLVVAAEHRRHGLGSLLLEGAFALAGAEGRTHIGLEVDEDNAPARRLYARHGFEELTRERFFEKALA